MLVPIDSSVLFDDSFTLLNTGDIVLFAGTDMISSLIAHCTGSKWTHVGMVVRPSQTHHEVLLWESLYDSKLRDVQTGKIAYGVTMVPLSKRLKGIEKQVAIRLLRWKRTATHLRDLAALRKELRGRPYEQKLFQLVKAAYHDYLGANEEDLSSLFCSELVAAAYKRMGLLDSGPDSEPSNDYVPGSFAEAFNLPLRDGASLGPELSLDQLLEQTREDARNRMMAGDCLDDLNLELL